MSPCSNHTTIACADYEIEGNGDGWRRQSSVWNTYMADTGVSKSTAQRHFKDYSNKIFVTRKQGKRVYYRHKAAKK